MTANLIAEARAVIEAERCVRTGSFEDWCDTHDGHLPAGADWCDRGIEAPKLFDTATKLLAVVEAVTAALSVRAQAEALDRVLAQPMSLDELRAALARAALTPKEE